MTKPILFNTDMTRALLEDRKTVTRRVVKPQPEFSILADRKGRMPLSYWVDNERWVKPPYQPGDILYVRETFHQTPNGQYWYKADNLCNGCTEDGFCIPKGVKHHTTCKICEYYDGYQNIKWRPSIHMPREAARIFLRVTDVRVERLQSMTEADAVAEGLEAIKCDCPCGWPCTDCMNTGYLEPAMLGFVETWDSTIKPADRALYGWDENPWVWVIEFERCEKPEEA